MTFYWASDLKTSSDAEYVSGIGQDIQVADKKEISFGLKTETSLTPSRIPDVATQSRGSKSVADVAPQLVSEADGWDPYLVSFSSAKKLAWVCDKGHRYSASPNQRIQGGRVFGCRYCANRMVWPGFNDLAHLFPAIAAEADGWDPSQVLSGSHSRKAWRCSLGHTWETTVKSRTGQGTRCPFCANQKAWPGFNDLATTHPNLAAEADGWDPAQVVAGSGKKLAWRCSHGHHWRAALNSRVAGNGCGVCTNHVIEEGVNDLATTHPELAAEADGWDPRLYGAGSHKKMPWICPKDHPFVNTIGHRAKGQGCPYCANKRVWPGLNDLATWFPELASEADGWDPTQEIKNSHHVRAWVCSEGHRWRAQNKSRCMGRGCAKCANYGFNPGKQAWLYLLNHAEWRMSQIGISNDIERRLSEHRRLGWEVVEVRGPLRGDQARSEEQRILKALKLQGVRLGFIEHTGPFSGYTEAWPQDDFPVTSIAGVLSLLA